MASHHHRDKRETNPDSWKMGSNFPNSRNCFSVNVVYPSTENHARHQTIQFTPTDSTLKLKTSLEPPLFSHFSSAEEGNSRFLLVDLRFNQYWPEGSKLFLMLLYLILPITSSSEAWASRANLHAGSYIPIRFPPGFAMCFYSCLCSSFELFQHAKSSTNYLGRRAQLAASFVLPTGSA